MMSNNARLSYLVIIFGLIIISLACSGCTSSSVSQPSSEDHKATDNLPSTPKITVNPTETQCKAKVDVDGIISIEGGARTENPVTAKITLDATNLDDCDAKDVSAIISLTFKGHVLDQRTVNFGTVKVGNPIRKEVIMTAEFDPELWSQYKKNKYEGLNLNLDSITSSGLTEKGPRFDPPQYTVGDIITDDSKSEYYVIMGYYTDSDEYRIDQIFNEGGWKVRAGYSFMINRLEAETTYPISVATVKLNSVGSRSAYPT